MIHTEYRYETRSRDRRLFVTLYGEVDHHGAAALREELDALLLHERPARAVLDLAHVEFMDSAGLGLLMGRYRLMRELGGEMAIVNPNDRVLKILRLAGMERFFEISRSVKGEKL